MELIMIFPYSYWCTRGVYILASDLDFTRPLHSKVQSLGQSTWRFGFYYFENAWRVRRAQSFEAPTAIKAFYLFYCRAKDDKKEIVIYNSLKFCRMFPYQDRGFIVLTLIKPHFLLVTSTMEKSLTLLFGFGNSEGELCRETINCFICKSVKYSVRWSHFSMGN